MSTPDRAHAADVAPSISAVFTKDWCFGTPDEIDESRSVRNAGFDRQYIGLTETQVNLGGNAGEKVISW
jgi:hypothetical protein